MWSEWTDDDISSILHQLNSRALPFKHVMFEEKNGSFTLLGKGGFGYVYRGVDRKRSHRTYAIKVLGFKGAIDEKRISDEIKTQRKLSEKCRNIVEIYESKQLVLYIDDNNRLTDIVQNGHELKLFFILMEELHPVIRRKIDRTIATEPEGLINGEEKQVVKLMYDIAEALRTAHNSNYLHRDVKLENVFYSAKEKRYKLGDFGLARFTDDGYAKTIVFTDGYGAPEIMSGMVKDILYDKKADIYSFGMMIYVLLNEGRFPESDRYRVNAEKQYVNGYVLSRPKYGSDELFKVIARMCSYDSSDRYGSIEEILKAYEESICSSECTIHVKHKNIILAIAVISLAMLTYMNKIGNGTDNGIDTGTGIEYIFFSLCVVKFLIHSKKKDVAVINAVIAEVGIYMLYKTTGFTASNLLLLVLLLLSRGLFGLAIVIVKLTTWVFSWETLMVCNYGIPLDVLGLLGVRMFVELIVITMWIQYFIVDRGAIYADRWYRYKRYYIGEAIICALAALFEYFRPDRSIYTNTEIILVSCKWDVLVKALVYDAHFISGLFFTVLIKYLLLIAIYVIVEHIMIYMMKKKRTEQSF